MSRRKKRSKPESTRNDGNGPDATGSAGDESGPATAEDLSLIDSEAAPTATATAEPEPDTLTSPLGDGGSPGDRTPASLGLPGPLHDGLAMLASLKVTVVLFAMGIFIVLAGTFAQTKMGNWQAVDQYFRTFVAFVEFDVFAPKSFFPNRPDDELAIPLWGNRELKGFYFPGGWLIGACMLVNLLAAHMLRFKVQAKGTRLVCGLGTLAVGMIVTWLVVASGDNDAGLQVELTEAFLGWLWFGFVAALAVGFGGAVYAMVKLDRATRAVEWWSAATGAVTLAGLLAYIGYNGDEAELKPEQMRILWQLVKGETAAVALLVGCLLLFKKRAGIVLLHAGVGLLMLSELFVGMYAEEGQMVIREGKTVNFASDIRTVELAFVDDSGEEEKHVVIPEEHLAAGGTITHSDLPFTIRIVNDEDGNPRFHDNSKARRLTRRQAEELAEDEAGYRGEALVVAVDPAKPTNGVKDSDVDMATVWVDLEADGKSLGRWLFTQWRPEQTIVVDGQKYTGDLRFKRKYFPYSVHLVDIRKKDYVGTGTPRDYSSYVDLHDSETDFRRKDARIYMNNPLRYRGQTLYQSNYSADRRMIVDPATGRPEFEADGRTPKFEIVETTTLQIVTNRGWMLPYVCCMIVMTGMMHQFCVVLGRFLGRRRRTEIAEPRPSSIAEYVPVAVSLVIGLAFVAFMSRPAKTKPDQPALHEFGKLPVTSDGRVKPLDSLARHTLLVVTERERYRTFSEDDTGTRYNDRWVEKKSRPAIEWMLDTSTDRTKAEDYPVYRVTELSLINDLGMQVRPGFFRYSESELRKKISIIEERVESAQKVEPDNRTFDQRKALALMKKTGAANTMRGAFFDVGAARADGHPATRYLRIVLGGGEQWNSVPFLIPTGDEEDPWEPYPIAGARMWLRDFAAEKKVFDSPRIATLVEAVEATEEGTDERERAERDLENGRVMAVGMAFVEEMRKNGSYDDHLERTIDGLVERRVRLELADMIASAVPGITQRDAMGRATEALRDPPEEIAPQIEFVRERAREEMLAQRDIVASLADSNMVEELREGIRETLGGIDWDAETPPIVVGMSRILAAYRKGDNAAFAREIEDYQELLDERAAADAERIADLQRQIDERKQAGEDTSELDSRMKYLLGISYFPEKVRYEAWFNGFAPFWTGQWLSVFGFLLTIASWLLCPRSLGRAAFWLMALVFALATYALVARIYISGRPPVTNLYSSAVFIGWGAILFGLVLEAVYRTGLGTAVASSLGFLSLGIAQFLALEGDTIAVMQAVLDTNIWLATHVVCVTLGYAATFVAGVFGLVYVFFGIRGAPFLYSALFVGGAAMMFGSQTIEHGSLWGTVLAALALGSVAYGVRVETSTAAIRFDPKLASTLTNMNYGTLCFAILFSFVGTVLGGLWADDSWGRFWGWDPKENGALIIVLWNALVLHARWDGMVRNRGLAILAIAGNITTAWSWFGTNELGAGLHTYGFTEGRLFVLTIGMSLNLAIIVLASLVPDSMWRDKEEPGPTAKPDVA